MLELDTLDERPAEGQQIHKYLMTTEEAVQWIRKAPRATKFCVRVRIDTPIVGEDNQQSGRFFDDGAQSYLRVSGRQALDFVRGALSETLEKRGARWKMERQDYSLLDRKYVTYWIG